MTALAKHTLVFQSLHKAIQDGTYGEGSRLPSEMVLARKFNVSRPTIAHALRELTYLGLVERRAGSGSYVRFRNPPPCGQLGIIGDGLDETEILDPLYVAISERAEEKGWNLVRGLPLRQRDPEKVAMEWVQREVKGVFFAPVENYPFRDAYNNRLVNLLLRREIRVVLLDRDFTPYPKRSNCDLIGIDNFSAGFDLASHFFENGFLKLCFVAKPNYPATTNQRMEGALRATHEFTGSTLQFCVGNPNDPSFVKKLLADHKFSGIICSNDSTAACILQSLQVLGCSCPRDIRVAGFDDVRYAKLLSPPLTTIRQPCEELGTAAIDSMLNRLASPNSPARSVLLRAPLIIRSSSLSQ